jgi:hypothetical protein
MKECFLFTSYSDTSLKLKTSIDNLKKLSKLETDICIYSHYPITNAEQELSNFSIYDKDNPIPPIDTKASVFWNRYKNIRMDYYLPVIDYAIILQWVRGIKFLLDMGYELIHVITYDIELSKDVFDEYLKIIDGKSTFFKCNEKYPIQTYLFTVDKSVGDLIVNITYDDYTKSTESFGEHFLYEYLRKFRIDSLQFIDYSKWEHIEELLLASQITMTGDDVFSQFNMNTCRFILGDYGGMVGVLVYNVVEDTYFTVFGQSYKVSVDGDIFVKTNIPFSSDMDYSDSIQLNNIPIPQNYFEKYNNIKINEV